jgi:hypothetical protein
MAFCRGVKPVFALPLRPVAVAVMVSGTRREERKESAAMTPASRYAGVYPQARRKALAAGGARAMETSTEM